jgi:ATP-dependent Clp protease ATP-binding subunit ClpA
MNVTCLSRFLKTRKTKTTPCISIPPLKYEYRIFLLLDEYSRDLTAFAQEGKLDPVVGRRREIDRVIRILSRRTKNNPVLVGEPGVGETVIVNGNGQAGQRLQFLPH